MNEKGQASSGTPRPEDQGQLSHIQEARGQLVAMAGRRDRPSEAEWQLP